jgi:hypothetical protein
VIFQLNTGRPLGVPNPDEPLVRTGRNPHFDGRFPDTVKLTARPEVFPFEVQRMILWDNARRLYPRIS